VTLVSLGVLTFVSGTFFGPDPSFPKPAIERVRIVGDTVWFEGTRGFDAQGTRYCFIRRTGTWCRLPLPMFETPTANVPRTPRDSVVVAPGLTLVCRPSDNWPSSCDTYGVLADDDRAVRWLIPQITRSTRDALQKAIELETEAQLSVSTLVTAQVAEDRAIWFGLGGGFPEGEGAFGGLLRFDRERRTIETITYPGLANATVTGLVIDGGALWIGTIHPGEYGPWGSTGILRRDLRGDGWAKLDSATTALPDNLIQALAASNGALYVATADGLAVFESKTKRWSVRYFRRTLIADSIVYALATARPADEAGDEAMFILMQRLQVGRRATFAATMRQIGLERLRPVLVPREGTFEQALAHPALVPFLVEALATPDAASLAASALARIGDPAAAASLRAALARTPDIQAGAPIAAALAQLGDSTGLAWLRDRLRSGAPWYMRRGVLTALATVRDTSSVGPLLSLLVGTDTDDDLRGAAMSALRAYESTAVWRRVIDTAAQVPELRRRIVDAADSVALNDAVVAAAVGRWALARLDSAGQGDNLYQAIAVAARLRPYDAVPALVRVLSVSEVSVGPAAAALVRLTGVDTAPPISPWRPDGRRPAQEFWSAWWRANAASYRVVSPDVGKRAYDAWWERALQRLKLERQRRPGARRGD
jgi:hypothetical protein